MTAIAAAFADFRPVKSRGVYQIILEVPAENANAVLIALGGVPVFGSEQWVGVAPLKAKPEPEKPKAEEPPATGGPVDKERRRFHTLPRSQQAAILINTPEFCEWWNPDHPPAPGAEMDADLKSDFRITSKRDLDYVGSAASKWDAIVERFRSKTGQSTWQRPDTRDDVS